MQAITVLTTGGTIDKVYFDAKSEFEVGASVVGDLLREARAGLPVTVRALMRKDSLELDDADRAAIAAAVEADPCQRIIVTHGTDTMVDTGRVLIGTGKVVVLTGALAPGRFAESDAAFNLGMAFAAAQTLAPGVYVCMNAEVFDLGAERVRKDRERGLFVRE